VCGGDEALDRHVRTLRGAKHGEVAQTHGA
jgi:hypothetical protein